MRSVPPAHDHAGVCLRRFMIAIATSLLYRGDDRLRFEREILLNDWHHLRPKVLANLLVGRRSGRFLIIGAWTLEGKLRMKIGELVGGRFELQHLVGSGGMGQVYRARDLTTGNAAALKDHALRRAVGSDALRARGAGAPERAPHRDRPVYRARAHERRRLGVDLREITVHATLRQALVYCIGRARKPSAASPSAAGANDFHQGMRRGHFL